MTIIKRIILDSFQSRWQYNIFQRSLLEDAVPVPSIFRILICAQNFKALVERYALKTLAFRKRSLSNDLERSWKLNVLQSRLGKSEEINFLESLWKTDVFQVPTPVKGTLFNSFQR